MCSVRVFLYVRKQQCDLGFCYYGDLTVKHVPTHMTLMACCYCLYHACVTLLQLFSFRNLTFRIHVYVYIANTPYSVTVMHVVSIS